MIRGIATSSSPTYDCESNMDNRIKFFLKEALKPFCFVSGFLPKQIPVSVKLPFSY